MFCYSDKILCSCAQKQQDFICLKTNMAPII